MKLDQYSEVWGNLIVLRKERKKAKLQAYCYCTEYHRYGWTRYSENKGPRAKSGVAFPIRLLEECKNIEEYIAQWKWIPTSDYKYERSYINKKTVRKHRFMMETKLGRKLAESELIDHIDGNGLNNSFDNLRIVDLNDESMSVQHINVSRAPTSSGHRYIYLEGKFKDRYKVQIGKNYVGCKSTIEEAVELRNEWMKNNDLTRLQVFDARYLV